MQFLKDLFHNPRSTEAVSEAWQELEKELNQQNSTPTGGPISLDAQGNIMPSQRQPTEATPVERWGRQVSGLISSENPVLQEEGLKLLGAYQQRATAPKTAADDPRTANQKEYDRFVANTGFEGNILDYMQRKAPKTFESGLDKPISDTDRKNYTLPDGGNLPIGASRGDAQRLGARFQAPLGADAAGRVAMLNTAQQMFPLLDSVIIPEDGQINTKALDGAFLISLDPTPGKMVSKKTLTGIGGYSPSEISLANRVANAFELGFQGITRTETGAAMPPEEVQNTKARFQPLPTDDDGVRVQRYLAYKYFIENAVNLIDPRIQRGGSPAELTSAVNKAVDEALAKFGVGGEEINSEKEQAAKEDAEYKFD